MGPLQVDIAIRGRWRHRAAALRFTQRSLEAVLWQTTARAPTPAELDATQAWLASPQGLTLHTSTFTRRDVLQSICEALPAGAAVDVADLERLADRFLGCELVCPVSARPGPGDSALGSVEEWRHTTWELLATEATAVAAASQRRAEGVGMVPSSVLGQVLAAHGGPNAGGAIVGEAPADPAPLLLSDEQVAMVRALVSSGDGVQLVNAKAGSGKTLVLSVARAAWEQAGYRVIGTALAARAARQLQRSAGIPADTIAKLLGDLDDPTTAGFADGTVLVIDESGGAPRGAVLPGGVRDLTTGRRNGRMKLRTADPRRCGERREQS